MNVRNKLSGGLLLVFGGWLWVYAGTFPELEGGHPGPSLFPRLIAIGLAAAGLALLLRREKRPAGGENKTRTAGGFVRFGVGLLLVIAYPLLAQSIHFVPVMAGLILAFGLLLRNPAWHALLMAVLSAGLMFLLFTRLLGVPL